MNEQDRPRENFLERWSRKKAETQREEADAPPSAAAPAATDTPPERRDEPAAIPAIPFDISSLPSLESITSATDIRAFLAPGVPQDLTRAALRRAWTMDPAIRDFVGLQENDWDFTKPDGVPGFGALPSGIDIKKMIAQIFGEAGGEPGGVASRDAGTRADEPQASSTSHESAHAQTPPVQAPTTDDQPHTASPDGQPAIVQSSRTPAIVQSSRTVASQNDPAQFGPQVEAAATPVRRRHGRALPQ